MNDVDSRHVIFPVVSSFLFYRFRAFASSFVYYSVRKGMHGEVRKAGKPALALKEGGNGKRDGRQQWHVISARLFWSVPGWLEVLICLFGVVFVSLNILSY